MFKKGIAAAAFLTIASPAAAQFDMESVTPGAYAGSLVLNDGDLQLTVTTEGNPNGYILASNWNVGLLGNVALSGSNTSTSQLNQWTPLRFSFNQLIDNITFEFGDAGGESDSPVSISAYTLSGTLLGSATTSYGMNVNTGGSLNLNFLGASYYIASSGIAGQNANSLGWEISALNPVVSNVPEPATWAMMLIGFGAVGFSMRNRRRKHSIALA